MNTIQGVCLTSVESFHKAYRKEAGNDKEMIAVHMRIFYKTAEFGGKKIRLVLKWLFFQYLSPDCPQRCFFLFFEISDQTEQVSCGKTAHVAGTVTRHFYGIVRSYEKSGGIQEHFMAVIKCACLF